MIDTELIPFRDWSGLTKFADEGQVYCPKNESEVSSLVHDCYAQNKKLRVVALRTSWNAWWHCDDVVMSTKYLNAIEEIDLENHTVTCQSGISLEDLHKSLWEKGLTLNTAPGIGWCTVGGAIATGSHGSGVACISASMIGCRLVLGNAEGEVIEIKEGDERLNAVRNSQGMLGILTSVTLRVVDAFYVSLSRIRILTKDWQRFLNEGEMSYALWFPGTEYTVIDKVDILPSAPSETRLVDPSASRLKYTTSVLELANIEPSTFAARNRYLLDTLFGDLQLIGPAHEVLMSFQTSPIAGSEWAVPYERFDAALADMEKGVALGDLHLPAPVYLKKVEGDQCWLSAADVPSVQCGMYHCLIDGTPAHSEETVRKVERLMLPYGGRPHLGKLIYLEPTDMRRMYPRWSEFNNLRQQMDPTQMFLTPAIQQVFGYD